MIKYSCFVLILLGSFSQMDAQNILSAHGGLNYSSVSSKNSINPDAIFGINAGFAYKYYVDDLGWSLTPEINFSQEGFKNLRLDYINIPLSVGFDFTSTFNFSVGFQYAYLLTNTSEIQDVMEKSNFAFLVSFEFFPTDRFVTGLRFANGIKDILKAPYQAIDEANTYSIQFYVGYNLFAK